MGAFDHLFDEPISQDEPVKTPTVEQEAVKTGAFDHLFEDEGTGIHSVTKQMAERTLGQPAVGQKIAMLREFSDVVVDPNDTEKWSDVPSNFVHGVGEFGTGMVTLGSAFMSGLWNIGETAGFWGDVFAGQADKKKNVIREAMGLEQVAPTAESQKADSVTDFYGQIFTALGDDFGALADNPIEAVKKDPFGQLLNVSMVLSAGGASLGKGAQIAGKTSKVGASLAKTGQVLGKTAVGIDPILSGIKVSGKLAKKIPVLDDFVNSIKQSSAFNKSMGLEQKQTIQDALKDINDIKSSWGALSLDEAKNVESWMKGLSTPVAKGSELVKLQKAYDSAIKLTAKIGDEFSFNEVGNLAVKADNAYKTTIGALDTQLNTLKKLNPKVSKQADDIVNKMSKDSQTPNMTEGSIDDIADWGVVKYAPDSTSRELLTENVSKKLSKDRLVSEKSHIIENSTINEQRAYWDLAVASGIRKKGDLLTTSPKNLLKKSEIDEMKKFSTASYFPDKVVGKSGGIISKAKDLLKVKTPAFAKRRTGKARESGNILDPESALKVHAIQAAQHRAKINTVTNIMSDLAKEGKVLPMLEGELIDGFVSANVGQYNLAAESILRIEENILNLVSKGEPLEAAITKSARLGEEIASDLAKAPIVSFQIEKNAANNLKTLFPEVPGFVKAFVDTPTNIFRTSVLALSPRWIVNGAVGNLLLNTVAGVGPIAYARMFPKFMDEMYKGFKDVDPKWTSFLGASKGASLVAKSALGVSKKITDKSAKLFEKSIGQEGRFFIWEDDLLPIQLTTGLTEAEKYTHNFMRQTAAEVADQFVKRKGFADGMFDVNGAMDNYFRRVHYVDKASKLAAKQRMSKAGQSALETIDDTRFGLASTDLDMWKTLSKAEKNKVVDSAEKFLFDYANLSSIEKTWLRRVVPFWSWYRNINKFMFYSLPQMPFRRGVMKQISDVGVHATGEDDLPEWMQGAVSAGMSEAGDQLYISAKGMIPFADTEKVLDDPLKSIGLNPVIKFPIERIMKADMFTGKPFDAEGQVRPGIKIDPVTGEEERILPPLLMHVARQLPQLKLAEEFLAPAAIWDDSTLINPKIKRAHSKVEELRRKILTERKGARPKTRKQRMAKEKKLADLQVQYEEALDSRAKHLVDVWSIKGKESVEAKFPIDVKLKALSLLGLKVTPFDIETQREFKQKRKDAAISARFKDVYDKNIPVEIGGETIGFRDLVEKVKLEQAVIKSSKSYKRKKKRESRRR